MSAPLDILVWYAPKDRWLAALAEGWKLPWIVSEMEHAGHGQYSIMLTKDAPCP